MKIVHRLSRIIIFQETYPHSIDEIQNYNRNLLLKAIHEQQPETQNRLTLVLLSLSLPSSYPPPRNILAQISSRTEGKINFLSVEPNCLLEG